MPSLVEQAKAREGRRDALKERLAAQDAADRAGNLTSAEIQHELRDRLKAWRELLCRQVAQARQILRKLLVGRLTFTPDTDEKGTFFAFKGQGSLGRVLEGLVAQPSHSPLVQAIASPWGFEPAEFLLLNWGSVVPAPTFMNARCDGQSRPWLLAEATGLGPA